MRRLAALLFAIVLAVGCEAAIVAPVSAPEAPAALAVMHTCPAGWSYLEEQDWWTPVPELGGEGHIHMGMCFPWGLTISGVVTFTVDYTFHNNHGTFVKRKFQDDSSNEYGHIYTESFTPVTGGDETTSRTFTIDTRLMQDGIRLFRFYGIFDHVNGNQQIARSQYRVNVQNGKADSNYTGSLQINGSGWYKEGACSGCSPIADWGYTNADVLDWATSTQSGAFTVDVKHTLNVAAGGPSVIAQTAGYLDPAFHAVPPSTGTTLGSCQIGGSVTDCKGTKTYNVPGGLSAGAHVLVFTTCTIVGDRRHCGVEKVEFTVPGTAPTAAPTIVPTAAPTAAPTPTPAPPTGNSLVVAPTGTVGVAQDVTYSDGPTPKLRFIGPTTAFTVNQSTSSGTYSWTPSEAGAWTVKLKNAAGDTVLAEAQVTVSSG